LDAVQKIWAPHRKLFTPPGVPSWLRTWVVSILLHEEKLVLGLFCLH